MMGTANGAIEDARAELVDVEDVPDDDGRPAPRESAQSGVRAAPGLAARIDAALEASSRTEATLADVFRTAKFLSATIGAVRDANAALARELESLVGILAGGVDERTALAGRIQRLERVVDEAGADAARERDRLVSEHDKFIAMLLSDHERELESLRQRLSDMEANSRP
jgi:hypothetical protein